MAAAVGVGAISKGGVDGGLHGWVSQEGPRTDAGWLWVVVWGGGPTQFASHVPAHEWQGIRQGGLWGLLHALLRRGSVRLVVVLDSEYVFQAIIEWSSRWWWHAGAHPQGRWGIRIFGSRFYGCLNKWASRCNSGGCPHTHDLGLESMSEAEQQQVTSDVDLGGGNSCRSRSDAELSDIGLQYSSDGEELFSTDVSDMRLRGWLGEGSDSDGFGTDDSDTRSKRRRAGNQE